DSNTSANNRAAAQGQISQHFLVMTIEHIFKTDECRYLPGELICDGRIGHGVSRITLQWRQMGEEVAIRTAPDSASAPACRPFAIRPRQGKIAGVPGPPQQRIARAEGK